MNIITKTEAEIEKQAAAIREALGNPSAIIPDSVFQELEAEAEKVDWLLVKVRRAKKSAADTEKSSTPDWLKAAMKRAAAEEAKSKLWPKD